MHNKTKLLNLLQAGIQKLEPQGFSVSLAIQEKLIEYIELLSKWTEVHNLTAVRDPEEMIKRHILDSLTVIDPLLQIANEKENAGGKSILDVGTGAGLPGIPLALCLPEYTVMMLDSSQKKINFVQHVILSLKISNAAAICARVESYQPKEGFAWVISRAFASLEDFIRQAGHLCNDGGRLISMKAKLDNQELEAVLGHEMGNTLVIQNKANRPQTVKAVLDRIQPVKVPFVEEDRCLVFVSLLKNGDIQC